MAEMFDVVIVCGETSTRSPAYQQACRSIVERIAAEHRDQILPGSARIRTVEGPQLPDQTNASAVEGFVRAIQMMQGVGLRAYRTEFHQQDGFSFLIIYVLAESGKQAAAQVLTTGKRAPPEHAQESKRWWPFWKGPWTVVAAVGVLVLIAIASIVLVRVLKGSGVLGIDSPVKVQDGRVRVTGAERADSFTLYGRTVRAPPGHELIFVSMEVKGEVPLAGVGEGIRNLSEGEWALADANDARYGVAGLVEGKLVFQVKKPSRGLVLWLGEQVSIPLGTLLGEDAASVGATLTEKAEPNSLEVSTATPRPTQGQTPSTRVPTATGRATSTPTFYPTPTPSPAPKPALSSILDGTTAQQGAVQFSPDGTVLASGAHDNLVRLWDVETGKQIAALEGHARGVTCLAFSPDGKVLASGGGYERTVRLWNVETGQELRMIELAGGVEMIYDLAFSPNGSRLAIAGIGNQVQLWDVSTGTKVTDLQGHNKTVGCLASSPDGMTLASGSYDDTIRLWNWQTGEELAVLESPAAVEDIAFSPDGALLASADMDGVVRLWDVATRAELTALRGFRFNAVAVAFSPDGAVLAGSGDEIIRLWDLATFEELALLEGHTQAIQDIAFAIDRFTLASASGTSGRGRVFLWNLEPVLGR